jgi:hypothetical protein
MVTATRLARTSDSMGLGVDAGGGEEAVVAGVPVGGAGDDGDVGDRGVVGAEAGAGVEGVDPSGLRVDGGDADPLVLDELGDRRAGARRS